MGNQYPTHRYGSWYGTCVFQLNYIIVYIYFRMFYTLLHSSFLILFLFQNFIFYHLIQISTIHERLGDDNGNKNEKHEDNRINGQINVENKEYSSSSPECSWWKGSSRSFLTAKFISSLLGIARVLPSPVSQVSTYRTFVCL